MDGTEGFVKIVRCWRRANQQEPARLRAENCCLRLVTCQLRTRCQWGLPRWKATRDLDASLAHSRPSSWTNRCRSGEGQLICQFNAVLLDASF